MERKGKEKEISGWYVQEKLSPEEKTTQMRAIGDWYEKKHRLNYRTVPLEIPGKMMLALGKLALEKGMNFSELIEEVLDGYLRGNKIPWRTMKG
jgi:hypothetical protein